MDLKRYDFEKDKDSLEYYFYSEGPKGTIKKTVKFKKGFEFQTSSGTAELYNLGFGDWDKCKNTIDDMVITDNQDSEQVLATVAAIIIDFINRHPDAAIFARGSTPSRTRKYQMGINKYLKEIQAVFEVLGEFKDNRFTPFRASVNYLSFIAIRKLK